MMLDASRCKEKEYIYSGNAIKYFACLLRSDVVRCFGKATFRKFGLLLYLCYMFGVHAGKNTESHKVVSLVKMVDNQTSEFIPFHPLIES